MGTIESNHYRTYDTGFQSECNCLFSTFRRRKVTKCHKDLRAVSPCNIRFTKAVISSDFNDGYSLIETFLEMYFGILKFQGLQPPITIMGYEDSLYVLRGNRRIFLAKVLEANGVIRTVDVVVRPFDPEVFKQHFKSLNMGESVEVDKHPNMEKKLNSFIQEYRRQKFVSFWNFFASKDFLIPVSVLVEWWIVYKILKKLASWT